MSLTRRGFAATIGAGYLHAAAPKTGTPSRPQFLVAALTMTDKQRKLDDGLTKDYLAFLAAGGADGVLVMGTTGEFSSFSVSERKKALESHVKHRGKMAVMAQVATPNLPETLDLADHAAGAGADSILVLPPFYFKNPPADGLVAFFEPVLNRSKAPVYLYNIPQTSGVAITPELVRRLSGHPNLAGTKDSFNKADVMTEFIKEFPKLRIITGLPANITRNLKEGGAGVITGNGSVFARETMAVFEAFRKGEDMAQAQAKLDERSKLLGGYDGVPAMRYALSFMGLRESYPRPPFVELSAEKKAELRRKLGAPV